MIDANIDFELAELLGESVTTNGHGRGFFTFAQNSGAVDYLRMAYALALSLRATQKEHYRLSVGVTPGTTVPSKYLEVFDQVIEIPWGDAAQNSEWKLENEWKAYHMTPYSETIKLDCDMLFTSDISHWWDYLAKKDFWASTTAMTYRGDVVTSDFYRKVFTACDLPNAYSAFTYFKKCELSEGVFDTLELITQNWDKFSWEFLGEHRPPEFSTDVALAMAIKLRGVIDECTEPDRNFPAFVHMKTRLQDWDHRLVPENWDSVIPYFLNSSMELKIANYRQVYPVHYHSKTFMVDDLIKKYENTK